jgi:hypothetical protein
MQSVRSEKGKAEAEKKALHLEQVGTEKQPTILNSWAPKIDQNFEQMGTEKSTKIWNRKAPRKTQFGTGGHRKKVTIWNS